jgi:hypothetical protein
MFVPPPPRDDSPLANRQGTPGQVTWEDVRTCVATLRAAGAPPSEITQKLMELGLDAETAQVAQEEASAVAGRRRKRRRLAGIEDLASAAHAAGAGESLSSSGPPLSGFSDVGRRNMAIGGVVCVIGVIVTVATYAAASGPGGGRYIIAWGAIVFGAIQFLRGASQR